MSNSPFVDKDGNKLDGYNAYIAYYKANVIETMCDTVIHTDDESEYSVCISTRQSGLKYGFKLIVTCEDDHECKYHGHIEECNGEIESVALHQYIRGQIIAGDPIEDEELIVIEEN